MQWLLQWLMVRPGAPGMPNWKKKSEAFRQAIQQVPLGDPGDAKLTHFMGRFPGKDQHVIYIYI